MKNKRSLRLLPDGCYEVPLTRGLVAIVDSEDAAEVGRHSWCADPRPRTVYAKSRIDGRVVYLHRFVCDTADHVDHKDGDGLNNRRSNLRPATRSQNGANAFSTYGESKYKGVSRSSSTLNPWRAAFMHAGKFYDLGIFADEESAARAYNEAAVRIAGEFACINDVADGPIERKCAFTDPDSKRANQSGFKGVTRSRRGTKWDAIIWDPSRKGPHRIGTFPTAIEAALAYDAAAIEMFGEFAATNASLGLIESELVS